MEKNAQFRFIFVRIIINVRRHERSIAFLSLVYVYYYNNYQVAQSMFQQKWPYGSLVSRELSYFQDMCLCLHTIDIIKLQVLNLQVRGIENNNVHVIMLAIVSFL